MRLTVFAVGRMKSGPETELVSRYSGRLTKAGRSLGLEFGGQIEIAESRAQTSALRRREESARCAELGSDPSTILILLDERGKSFSSSDFAGKIAGYRDDGIAHLVFALGGPDGHDPSLRDRADLVLSFGEQTWPHQLARIMLAEQLYRATTILSGHPYHRG
ncbi:23S rRNA (pseudouridine(1915)-N(3))-methyltransferase RlmH [Oricola cellulosilytica]|uniref:Ribosomal RNA large subunit methyltransferase H n=1 Tax=Oricola cellulosilytica TaxID=1429082 RepID=A0A4R0PEK6_9HYPH|nr:23S rRNA (pseudouridine(1915)-N(3))-methyltransferase RlmH [Oricola cellulosilytica]TCD13803.1 23S rRNA (pseudouridine(1915)-N(3))-methyltransferase RlmH [Oricola cellulosilytica]